MFRRVEQDSGCSRPPHRNVPFPLSCRCASLAATMSANCCPLSVPAFCHTKYSGIKWCPFVDARCGFHAGGLRGSMEDAVASCCQVYMAFCGLAVFVYFYGLHEFMCTCEHRNATYISRFGACTHIRQHIYGHMEYVWEVMVYLRRLRFRRCRYGCADQLYVDICSMQKICRTPENHCITTKNKAICARLYYRWRLLSLRYAKKLTD